MVHQVDKNGERLHVCDACGFAYKERSWGEKCQDYCTKHGACSLEITSHAVQTRPQNVQER